MNDGLPERLSINPKSPYYDMKAARRVDKVYVDGVEVPQCVAYDMIAGWAFGLTPAGSWGPKIKGTVTVTERQAP